MKKGKASYQALIRSVLRVPFEKKERGRIALDAVPLHEGRTGLAVNTTVYSGLLKEELAFFRAYNSALAEGIIPDAALLSLTFPTRCTEAQLKESMEAFRRAAKRENTAILGGHTAFSENIHAPVLTAVISGAFSGSYGTEEAPEARPGQALILTRFPGDAGAMLLLEGKKDALYARFSREFLSPVTEAADAFSLSEDARILRRHNAFMHDVSEGGILGALWELSEGAGYGFAADLPGIPMHQETVEITEFLGLDPYRLYSCGSMLAAVSDPEETLNDLWDAGIPAARIGEIRTDKKKLLLHDGEERCLDRPSPDPVYLLENFG